MADQQPWMQATVAQERCGNGPGLPGFFAGSYGGARLPAPRRGRAPGPDLLVRLALPAVLCQGLALVAER